MRVAIVHYHLKRGGVTRVVENTLGRLLERGVEVVVLAEEASGLDARFASLVATVPELAYQTGAERVAASDLERGLRDAARNALGGDPDVWHVHNHHLAKNTSLTEVVSEMAIKRDRLLLHIHDFPEDGRASNYQALRDDLGAGVDKNLRSRLYPVGERVLYGVLNGRDHQALLHAGIPAERMRLLANPVKATEPFSQSDPVPGLSYEELILYPTRAIRRKNLGELLLWAAMAPEGRHFGCTLAPDNPQARPIYDRWVACAQDWALPVSFELGNRDDLSFPELMGAANALVTTSVAEGFGLGFLEPWVFGRPLVGRNLPLITKDFTQIGLALNDLYDRVDVPLSWLDGLDLKAELETAVAKMYEQYSIDCTTDTLAATYADLTRGDVVDFGRLTEEMQELVIQRVVKDPDCGSALNPSALPSSGWSEASVQNRALAEREFSLDAYGDLLIGCYEELANATPDDPEWIEPSEVLNQFLAPANFSFLRA